MAKSKFKVTEAKVTDLVFDDKNFNKGTEYGKALLDKSMQKFGAGRSVLLDKNNRLIAGNKASETFGELGNEKVVIVETTGDTLVAVKRTDIDLDTPEGREMAMADNATAKADICWDNDTIGEVSEELGIDPGDWGVVMEGGIGDETAEVGSSERASSQEGEYLTFAGKKVLMTDEEKENLLARFEEYVSETGFQFGFVTSLLNGNN